MNKDYVKEFREKFPLDYFADSGVSVTHPMPEAYFKMWQEGATNRAKSKAELLESWLEKTIEAVIEDATYEAENFWRTKITPSFERNAIREERTRILSLPSIQEEELIKGFAPDMDVEKHARNALRKQLRSEINNS